MIITSKVRIAGSSLFLVYNARSSVRYPMYNDGFVVAATAAADDDDDDDYIADGGVLAPSYEECTTVGQIDIRERCDSEHLHGHLVS